MLIQRELIRLRIVVLPVKRAFNRLLYFSMSTTMLQQFSDEILGIEMKTGPLYIKLNSLGAGYGMKSESDTSNASGFFRDKQVYYLNSFVDGDSFARNVVRHRELEESLKMMMIGSEKKFDLFQGTVRSKSLFQRCMFLSVNAEPNNSAGVVIQNEMKQLAQRFQTGYVMRLTQANVLEVRNILENDQQIKYEITDARKPAVHPAFISKDTNSIYHELQRVQAVLDEYKDNVEIKELHRICNKYINPDHKLPLQAKYPVIVIEGLDATGKTTLTKNLGNHLECAVLKSPPECICHLRSKFDSYPQLFRRAFYSLGNYAFAAMIEKEARAGPVVVDRFWNSTAAYAIATDVNVGSADNLPPVGHWIYSWPSDLLKPDVIFLLTLLDEERRKRLSGRGTVKTDEEILLEESRLFRIRLEESYTRMTNPSMIKLDAGGSPEEVLNKTLAVIKSHKIIN